MRTLRLFNPFLVWPSNNPRSRPLRQYFAVMCYGRNVEDPGYILCLPASVRGGLAWFFALGVIGWFIYVCTQDRSNFDTVVRVGFLAGVWSATGLVIIFSCSYVIRPGRVAGDDTMHAVQHSATTSRIEGNYIITTRHSWCEKIAMLLFLALFLRASPCLCLFSQIFSQRRSRLLLLNVALQRS